MDFRPQIQLYIRVQRFKRAEIIDTLCFFAISLAFLGLFFVTFLRFLL
jgi:hypothetical protein